MSEIRKECIVDEIKYLITVDNSRVEINPNYLEYFTLEELQEIKDELLFKKKNKYKFTEQYVEELSKTISI